MTLIAMRLENVVKRFGDFTALHDINLDIYEGEFLTIVGPSGSGKTTLIRLLVGMDEPTEGNIYLRDEVINTVPANKRPTCMVFQSLALFPHRSVGQNIEFPLKIKGISPVECKARAMELLDLLHLPRSYYDRRVTQCSGGERQRVALARALAFDPEILFFDEPLSALDYRLRKTLEKELKDLHRRTGKTFVYITHSLEEAMVMSDRICIMQNGEIAQLSTAADIYATPASPFVAEFIGDVNLFAVMGSIQGKVEVLHDGSANNAESSASSSCSITIVDEGIPLAKNTLATLMVRPEFVRFIKAGESADCVVKGKLLNEFCLGSRFQYSVVTDSGKLISVEKLGEDRFTGARNDTVYLGWDIEHTHLIPKEEESH